MNVSSIWCSTQARKASYFAGLAAANAGLARMLKAETPRPITNGMAPMAGQQLIICCFGSACGCSSRRLLSGATVAASSSGGGSLQRPTELRWAWRRLSNLQTPGEGVETLMYKHDGADVGAVPPPPPPPPRSATEL